MYTNLYPIKLNNRKICSISLYQEYNKSPIHWRMRNMMLGYCMFFLYLYGRPSLSYKSFWNKNRDAFYSSSSINDVKNVFLYAFCKNDLEMWHKWFLNTRQGSNRVPQFNAMLNWCTQACMNYPIHIWIFL